ncbi:MAG: galactokinase [Candidatus Thorarchaeota archaeon]|nr:galactokinase [Candidatus Thorarchaeota archaeon]
MDENIQTVLDALSDLGVSPEEAVITRAPGRVEVLGNHVDYNGGLVLAASIERYVWAAGVRSDQCTIHSVQFDETVTFSPHNQARTQSANWHDFVRGVLWALERRRQKVTGLTVAISGNVPIGGGLSSSAALEVAVVNLIAELNELRMPPQSLAMIAFEAERLFCGVSCGIMDQFTSQLCKPDSLLAIHCASMHTADIPLSKDLGFLIINTGVSRNAGDALNQRLDECNQALIQLQKYGWDISALGQVELSTLERAEQLLDDTLAKRVRHVVLESERVRQGIDALRAGDIHEFGRLMYESHESSRDLYEVSHITLDSLVDIARRQPAVLGARLTGAGFGGSIICLVKKEAIPTTAEAIVREYEAATNMTASWISTGVPGGVTLLDSS